MYAHTRTQFCTQNPSLEGMSDTSTGGCLWDKTWDTYLSEYTLNQGHVFYVQKSSFFFRT